MGKILAAVVIGLCAFAWRVYESMDYGRSIYNHRPGVCNQVNGPVKGSEDIELVRSEGIAFITSGVLYMHYDKKPVEGEIFMYNFADKTDSDKLAAKELPIKGDSFDKKNFFPHGLSSWVVDGKIRLYVINHDREFKHSAEVFEYDPSGPALVHKKSVVNERFVRPNGIVAVGPDQFIITNDGMAQTTLTNFLEILSGIKAGSVVYWDGKVSHTILSGMGSPNGITYDKKNSKLFVMEVSYKSMHVYDFSKEKKTATIISSVNLHSTCDNLFLDSDGSIYLGCHPLIHETVQAVQNFDADITSASQVLHVRYSDDYKTTTVTEPYSNDGKEVSGSSVAVLHKNQMLIGTVCKGLLHCQIADPSIL